MVNRYHYTVYKYLGVEMCSDMKWKKKQITCTTNKQRKMIYIIKKIHEILQLKELRTVYETLFQTIITHGIT